MIPGVNPKQMAQAMKAMGIKQKEIDADEVVIRGGDREIVISSPQVIEIDMKGVKTFQVMGEIEERAAIPEGDVKMVAGQAGVSEEKAREALKKSDGDIAKAIMGLSNG